MPLIVSPETEARLYVIAAQRGLPPEAALDILVNEAFNDKTPDVNSATDAPGPCRSMIRRP